MLSANLRLQELNTGKKARVVTAVKMAKHHLFQYQGYIGAYLLIGGVDSTGAHLYDVSASGYSLHLPFAADGSGSYCSIAILERDFKMGMTVRVYEISGNYPAFLARRRKGSCSTCFGGWYAW